SPSLAAPLFLWVCIYEQFVLRYIFFVVRNICNQKVTAPPIQLLPDPKRVLCLQGSLTWWPCQPFVKYHLPYRFDNLQPSYKIADHKTQVEVLYYYALSLIRLLAAQTAYRCLYR